MNISEKVREKVLDGLRKERKRRLRDDPIVVLDGPELTPPVKIEFIRDIPAELTDRNRLDELGDLIANAQLSFYAELEAKLREEEVPPRTVYFRSRVDNSIGQEKYIMEAFWYRPEREVEHQEQIRAASRPDEKLSELLPAGTIAAFEGGCPEGWTLKGRMDLDKRDRDQTGEPIALSELTEPSEALYLCEKN